MDNIKPTLDNMTRKELLELLNAKDLEISSLKKQVGAISHAVITNLRLTENLIHNVQQTLPILKKGSAHVTTVEPVEQNGNFGPKVNVIHTNEFWPSRLHLNNAPNHLKENFIKAQHIGIDIPTPQSLSSVMFTPPPFDKPKYTQFYGDKSPSYLFWVLLWLVVFWGFVWYFIQKLCTNGN